jgi:hypothetical protein
VIRGRGRTADASVQVRSVPHGAVAQEVLAAVRHLDRYGNAAMGTALESKRRRGDGVRGFQVESGNDLDGDSMSNDGTDDYRLRVCVLMHVYAIELRATCVTAVVDRFAKS